MAARSPGRTPTPTGEARPRVSTPPMSIVCCRSIPRQWAPKTARSWALKTARFRAGVLDLGDGKTRFGRRGPGVGSPGFMTPALFNRMSGHRRQHASGTPLDARRVREGDLNTVQPRGRHFRGNPLRRGASLVDATAGDQHPSTAAGQLQHGREAESDVPARQQRRAAIEVRNLPRRGVRP